MEPLEWLIDFQHFSTLLLPVMIMMMMMMPKELSCTVPSGILGLFNIGLDHGPSWLIYR
jgi:hypothetical protein